MSLIHTGTALYYATTIGLKKIQIESAVLQDIDLKLAEFFLIFNDF